MLSDWSSSYRHTVPPMRKLLIFVGVVCCCFVAGRGEDPPNTEKGRSKNLPLGTIVSLPSSSLNSLGNVQISIIEADSEISHQVTQHIDEDASPILQAISRAVSSLTLSQNGRRGNGKSRFGYVDGIRSDGTYDIQLFDGSYASALSRESILSAEQQIDHLRGGASRLSPDTLTPAQAEFVGQMLDLLGIPATTKSDEVDGRVVPQQHSREDGKSDSMRSRSSSSSSSSTTAADAAAFDGGATQRHSREDLRRRRRRNLANAVFVSSLSTNNAAGNDDDDENGQFFGHRDPFDGGMMSSLFHSIVAYVTGDARGASSLKDAHLNTLNDASARTSHRADVAEAHREIGKMFLHGTDDVLRDGTEALAHLQMAAQLGDAPSQRILALLPSRRTSLARKRTRQGTGEEREDEGGGVKGRKSGARSSAAATGRSIARLYFASMGGDLHATMALGHRHMYGLDVPKRCSTALNYYRAAARKVVEPLWLDDFGFMSTQDHFKLLHRRIANWKVFSMPIDSGEYDYLALTGDTDVQVSVARLLLGGAPSMGMQSDVNGAQEWLESAATMGNIKAAALLGRLLLQKARRTSERRTRSAAAADDDDGDIYRKGALQLMAYVIKRTTPHSQFSASVDVLTGIDRVFRSKGWGDEALPPSDWDSSFSATENLEGDGATSKPPFGGEEEGDEAKTSDDQTRAEALRVVGAAFLYGRSGFARDRKIAASALREASLLKNSEAMFDLAIVRLSGYGAPRSLRQALRLIQDAAAAKHKMAEYVWAEMRANGLSMDATSCESIVRTLKRVAEDNAYTVEALFEARRRYLSGDAEGALSVYLQLAGTGVGVAQANAANILTRPSTAAPIGAFAADTLHSLARPILNAIFEKESPNDTAAAALSFSSNLAPIQFVEAPNLASSNVFAEERGAGDDTTTTQRSRSFAERRIDFVALEATASTSTSDSWSATARVAPSSAARALAIDLYERAKMQGWRKAQRFLCDLRHEHRLAKSHEMFVSRREKSEPNENEETGSESTDDASRRVLEEIRRRSFECYSRAAKARDHEAAFRVGQLLALGIGTSRDLHGAAGMFHKAFQYARMVGERNSVVPVNIALAAIRLQVALENLAGSRSTKEIEEALARETSRATTKDKDGNIIKVGDAIRSRWLGGQRWWRGRVHAINQDRTIDVAYDDGDFETSVDASRFVSKSEEGEASSPSSNSDDRDVSDDGREPSFVRFAIVCPLLDALAFLGLSNPQGCSMLSSLPASEGEDIETLVLLALCVVGVVVTRLFVALLDWRHPAHRHHRGR